jgi:hypothetical protein
MPLVETTTATTPPDLLRALEELAARIADRADAGWDESDREAFTAELAELAAALEARGG